MKTLELVVCLALVSCTAMFGTPCVPGDVQGYVDLGTTGCNVATVQFSAFSVLPGLAGGTPVNPAQVQVTPGGAAVNPTLSFTLNQTASAGEAFESVIGFSASDSLDGLNGVTFGLTPPAVTGDAAVAGLLDVCPGGSFSGGAPFGCPVTPASLALFAIEGSSLLSDSARFPGSRSANVLIDLTATGGSNGSATLGSATVGFSSVPEPSAGLLVALALSAFSVSRARGRRLNRKFDAIRRGLLPPARRS